MKSYGFKRLWILVILLSVSLVISCRSSAMDSGLDPTSNGVVAPPAESPQADNGGEEKYFDLPRALTSTEDLNITGVSLRN
jgi:hypothetical protein